MEFKGTKGKWEITHKDRWGIDIGTPNQTVCSIRMPHASTDDKEQADIDKELCNVEARLDAQLIAAAPELLEALKGMLNIFDRNLPKGSIGERKCDQAKQAMNKALGK